MTKMHEIIAVENDREQVAKQVLEEASNTFIKKHQHFMGYHRHLEMFDEKRKNEEAAAEQHQEIETTVAAKLAYVAEKVIEHLDTNATKEATNQKAKADLIVGDQTLLTNVPATLLLSLENKLKKIREVYLNIPTLLPGINWELDNQFGDNVFLDINSEKSNKTEKVVQSVVVVPSTDKHPAQAQVWNADVPVGVYVTQKWSGMISPADKSKLLSRIDALIAGAKQARQRANEAEIVNMKVGKILFDFING
jgi:hypothetical protein